MWRTFTDIFQAWYLYGSSPKDDAPSLSSEHTRQAATAASDNMATGSLESGATSNKESKGIQATAIGAGSACGGAVQVPPSSAHILEIRRPLLTFYGGWLILESNVREWCNTVECPDDLLGEHEYPNMILNILLPQVLGTSAFYCKAVWPKGDDGPTYLFISTRGPCRNAYDDPQGPRQTWKAEDDEMAMRIREWMETTGEFNFESNSAEYKALFVTFEDTPYPPDPFSDPWGN